MLCTCPSDNVFSAAGENTGSGKMSAREVTLVGGSPWGFRMHGGHDLNQPLRISRVNPGSKAAQQGVREGDLISSINGKNTRDLTNADAHALLRNAGDQLKLGLNQESSGSPKGKVYKSSLQTDTSIETVHKTTTKTILNTRIVSSSEINKNGIDDTSRYSSLNGGSKKSEDRTDGEKKQDTENYCYATDAEESNTKMPCSSRNRRNRRNRNRKRIQRPTSPPKDISTSEAEEVDEQNFICDNHSVTEQEKIVVTNEVSNDLPIAQNLSIAKSRVKKNKCKIKQKQVDANSQVCEISNISTEPLTAKVDHIDGVGIVESGLSQDNNSVITIVEPFELVRTASNELTLAIKKEESDKDVVIKHNGVEISEVDSDVDVENSKTPIISENDSDRKEDSGDDSEKHIMSPDEEKNLRNFIETLQLPSLSSQNNHIARHKIDAEKIAAASIPYKKAYKRAILESYYSQSHEARCLDIIQEEGEKQSEEADQNIRDFINQEIGKFRRSDDYSRRQLSEESFHGENEWHNKVLNVMTENHLDEKNGSICTEIGCNSSPTKIRKNIVETIKKDALSKDLINAVTEKVTQMTNEIQEDLQMYNYNNPIVDNLQKKQKSNSTESEVPISGNDVDAKAPQTSSQIYCCDLNETPEIPSLPSNITISSRGQPPIPLIRTQIIRSTSDRNPCLPEMQPRSESHFNVSRYKTLEALLKKISENAIPSYAYPYYDVLCAITEHGFPNDSFLIFDTISQAILSHNCSKESLKKLPSFDKLNVPKIISDSVRNMQIKVEKFNESPIYEFNDNVSENEKMNDHVNNDQEGAIINSNKDGKIIKDDQKEIKKSVHGVEKNIFEISCESQNSIKYDFLQTDIKSVDCKKLKKMNDSNDDDKVSTLHSNSKALSPVDCSSNDLSNSLATVSTEKFYPLQASVTDITSVIEEEEQNNKGFGKRPRCQRRSPPLNRKLTLLQSLENIKYSSIKHLNHVPSNNILNEHPQVIMKENYYQPDTLTNISLKKLLSMPYGTNVIQKLIIESDSNIFGSNCDHTQSSLNKNTAKYVNSLNNQTTMGHRPNIWVGVPTEENPKLLVCLSPSQQESQVNTSVDKLLDLHTKFLNRTRCQTETKMQCVSPLLYHFIYDLSETQNNKCVNQKNNSLLKTCDKQERSKITQLSDWFKLARCTGASNSDYDINFDTNQKCKPATTFVSPVLYQFTLDQAHEDVEKYITEKSKKIVESKCHSTLRNSDPNEDRLELTRSCDWLKQARRNFTSELLTDDCNHSKDKIIITKPNAAIRNRIPERHYVNSALIVRGNDSSIRNTTPLRRSPISMNSAIIDKSPTTSDSKRTPTVCKRSWDLRHNVNPALIDDKPSMPAKAKRIVTVDRSCIDTRSLFDNCQSPIKVADTSQLKRVTAAEIMDNLKQLQASLVKQVNVQSEHSVPQRYFEEQLEYVEKLEKQLKKVILAEEDNELKSQVTDEFKLAGIQTSYDELKEEGILIKNIDDEEEKNTVIRRKNNHKNQKVFRNTTHFENLGRQSPRNESWKNEISERPKSTVLSVPTSGEIFRQMMFDEYVNKVLEREERKHLNVVKISSHADLNKQENKPNMSTVEVEFIEKAKNRLHKFGIQLDESESETNGEFKETEDKDSGAEAKCLVDGKEVTDAKNLPKHLREFLKIPRITEDENDVGSVINTYKYCRLVQKYI